MRDASVIDIDDVMGQDCAHEAIIDVRSPSEFARDHIPGAINLPVLSDAERAHVGTLDARQGAFVAKRAGAAMVSHNIGEILRRDLADKPPDWRPIVYCWRGGNRSQSLATVLARTGWKTAVLTGGYRSYRRWVLRTLGTLAPTLHWRVVAGRTGTGKSRILQALAERGHQVLDLESLANHRGSVLGLMPNEQQPTQKAFESQLLDALRRLDPERPVFVESESRKIGELQVSEPMIEAIRAACCIVVERPVAARVRFLIEDYAHFLHDPGSLTGLLGRLRALHGKARFDAWHAMIDAGAYEPLVQALLLEHYDPAYDRSIRKNFARLAGAIVITEGHRQEPARDDAAWFAAVADRIGASPAAAVPGQGRAG